jgi:magnesium-transporting ATPase (P-type)
LAEFPFDSTRKRMTLLVKFNSKYLVLTKGADSIMMPRLTIDIAAQQKMEADLYKFACDGLRTLVMAQKEISEADYKSFDNNFKQIKTSLDSFKDAKLNELFDKMEKGLTYVGASAIEDKLQVGVADTIERVMAANIRLWVLTGDKQETAIEIGKSCKLIQPAMEQVVLSSATREEFKNKLLKHDREKSTENN